MRPTTYIPLHVHSEFSFLEGMPKLSQVVNRAKELGYPALALTDHNRMSGLVMFYQACIEAGLQPILGVSLTEVNAPREPLILLARNAEGYGDICELISRRHLDGKKFRLDRAFDKPWPHLYCIATVPAMLRYLAGGPNRDRVYGGLDRFSPEGRSKSKALQSVCAELNLPVVAAGAVFYLERKDHETHRMLRAIDLNSTLSRLKPGETASPEAYLHTPAEMTELFADCPEALHNNMRIAADCKVELSLGKWIMPEIKAPNGYTPDTWLRRIVEQGLHRNYGHTPEFIQARNLQAMELGVIQKLGYASYFLMVKEVCEQTSLFFAGGYRSSADVTLLRGSAANSITFRNLGVSELCPLKHDLYFQRFLNEDRASPPDADLDFGWDERDRMLRWMVERFGEERVAITGTTNRFKYRSAFREAAKVLGVSREEATQLMAVEDYAHRRAEGSLVQEIRAWVTRLQGRPRFMGQHPGGVLVTNKPINRYVALEYSDRGETGEALEGGRRRITQIDMHSGIDELGLIKFDLLGNGSLSVLRDALENLHRRGTGDPLVSDVDKCCADAKTQALIREGRTRGIFYIESPAQIRLNQRAQAGNFQEITITSSLVRPAGTAYAKVFVERHRKLKQGIQDWDFLHPALQPLLHDTHDVCAFQEDVTKICHHVAGLSFKQADRVRKMMNSQHDGMPSTPEMQNLKSDFVEGCQATSGFTLAQAETLWERVSSFTGFSFCKSHSASYARLSFQCAYLKAHYPAAFLAAVISNNHGYYRHDVYLDEARRFGVTLLPMDINHSCEKFHGYDKVIRPGLLHVRELRHETLLALLQERDRGGNFQSLQDFLMRVPIGAHEAEKLIRVGAFDAFGLTRPELLFLLAGVKRNLHSDAPSLFGGMGGWREEDLHPGLTPDTLLQRCLDEKYHLGYMLSASPLEVIDLHPAARDAVAAVDIGSFRGKRIKVFGQHVTERMHPVADSGRPMQFLTLADRTGCIDVIFWPEVLERWSETLESAGPFEIWGKVQEDMDTFVVIADAVRPVVFSPELIDFERGSRRILELRRQREAEQEAQHQAHIKEQSDPKMGDAFGLQKGLGYAA